MSRACYSWFLGNDNMNYLAVTQLWIYMSWESDLEIWPKENQNGGHIPGSILSVRPLELMWQRLKVTVSEYKIVVIKIYSQHSSSHVPAREVSPIQKLPPHCGAGLLQFRVLVQDPEPTSESHRHVPLSLHSDHPPWTILQQSESQLPVSTVGPVHWLGSGDQFRALSEQCGEISGRQKDLTVTSLLNAGQYGIRVLYYSFKNTCRRKKGEYTF